jgi:dTDP-4-dehydrorhamnose 3,5-epimerase
MIQTFIDKQFVFFQVEKKNFSVWDLERHQTRDITDSHINGELTVIWRDWDEMIHNPEMVYINTVNPGEIKGPHIHKNRTSYFYCIDGKMVIIIQDKDGEYHEIETDSKESKLISVSNGVGAAIINPSKSISKILVLADIAWRPNENEMENISFKNYDWKKWFK